jgi:hypothetical protein
MGQKVILAHTWFMDFLGRCWTPVIGFYDYSKHVECLIAPPKADKFTEMIGSDSPADKPILLLTQAARVR